MPLVKSECLLMNSLGTINAANKQENRQYPSFVPVYERRKGETRWKHQKAEKVSPKRKGGQKRQLKSPKGAMQ